MLVFYLYILSSSNECNKLDYDSYRVISLEYTRKIISNEDIIVHSCTFDGLKALGSASDVNGMGGAIYYTSNTVSHVHLVGDMFSNCETTSSGGAVYVNMNSGSLKTRYLCAYKCFNGGITSTSAGQRGMFAFLSIAKYNPFLVEYVSISRCAHATYTTKNRYDTFYIYGGDETMKNLNSSNNYVFRYTGFTTTDSSTFSHMYGNYVNNVARDQTCVLLQKSTQTLQITLSNFISNNSPNNGGTIRSNIADISVSHCIFLNNANSLFSILSGDSYSVTNCWVYHSGTLGLAVTKRTSITQTFAFSHFSSYFCPANIPIRFIACSHQAERSTMKVFYVLIPAFLTG